MLAHTGWLSTVGQTSASEREPVWEEGRKQDRMVTMYLCWGTSSVIPGLLCIGAPLVICFICLYQLLGFDNTGILSLGALKNSAASGDSLQ